MGLLFDWIYFITAMSCLVIRIPHNKVSKQTKIEQSHRDFVEKITLASVVCGCTVLPLLYLFTPFLDFANQAVSSGTGILGTIFALIGLWLFYLSHKDLGKQWSLSLEIRGVSPTHH